LAQGGRLTLPLHQVQAVQILSLAVLLLLAAVAVDISPVKMQKTAVQAVVLVQIHLLLVPLVLEIRQAPAHHKVVMAERLQMLLHTLAAEAEEHPKQVQTEVPLLAEEKAEMVLHGLLIVLPMLVVVAEAEAHLALELLVLEEQVEAVQVLITFLPNQLLVLLT
jgi:hypothetical protein